MIKEEELQPILHKYKKNTMNSYMWKVGQSKRNRQISRNIQAAKIESRGNR